MWLQFTPTSHTVTPTLCQKKTNFISKLRINWFSLFFILTAQQLNSQCSSEIFRVDGYKNAIKNGHFQHCKRMFSAFSLPFEC